MKRLILTVLAVFLFAVSANAATIDFTVGGWGPTQFPADVTPPDSAPHGSDGYPGDTLEMEGYTGALDLTPGVYDLKVNTLKWIIDYTYGGTETDPDDWSEVSHAIIFGRGISFDGGPSGSISQDGLLENTWHNDYLTVDEGASSSFLVNGFLVEVTPLGIARTGGSDFSGSAPWTQPDMDVMARFEVSEASVPVPAAVWLLGSGLLGLAGLRKRAAR